MSKRIIKCLGRVVAVVFVGSQIFASPISTFAEQNSSIPDRMLAGTVIQYDENNNPVYLEEGSPLPTEKPKNTVSRRILTPEEQAALDKENKMAEEILEEAKSLPVFHIDNPKPQPGMKVIYDGEGYLKDIIYPEDQTTVGVQSALPQGTRKAPGTYTYGAHNNSIVITGTSTGKVQGTGRGTNFTDTYGDHGNYVLKKGDCATKGEIDNPRYDTLISVRNLDNDYVYSFQKEDNGSLPDAVVDIWKDGLSYLGLTYSPSVSFSGRYFYQF
ncbi:hypothetical protein BK138_34070 [Paenibacillus rhizosphaerae]|uniref:Uncharacterized protein n=1 Tax=Paenibacillus rhizosphaerae TaxID=297318 RepID=A0A1R1DZL8_9BACL|nr:hypothetical protein [Paenibacillus rhizosphaerae]OMF44999.1 hypothetical protein BK138_34070 [Paenibacillus rhizosphaerae]